MCVWWRGGEGDQGGWSVPPAVACGHLQAHAQASWHTRRSLPCTAPSPLARSALLARPPQDDYVLVAEQDTASDDTEVVEANDDDDHHDVHDLSARTDDIWGARGPTGERPKIFPVGGDCSSDMMNTFGPPAGVPVCVPRDGDALPAWYTDQAEAAAHAAAGTQASAAATYVPLAAKASLCSKVVPTTYDPR